MPEGAEPPFHDAEMVVYYSTLEDNHEWREEDGIPRWCEETGLGSVGLWARYGDDGVEIPLFTLSPFGVWQSLDASFYENSNRVPVSEAFIDAVHDPWEMNEEQHEALTEAEKLVSNSLRMCLFQGNISPEGAGVIEWCRNRAEDLDTAEEADA